MNEITLVQGILISLAAFIVGMDFYLEVLFWFRPIIIGTITGCILGDIQIGIIGGGITELAFAGLTPAGGTQPPNPILAGIMTPVLAHTTGVGAEQALALALPFSFLMQYIILMFWSGYSILMPTYDKYAKEGSTRKFETLAFGSLLVVGVVYAIVVFLCTYSAQDFMRTAVEMMPGWLTHGFEIIGGVLPAVGFAMLLKIMLKKWLIPYLIFGFVFASFIPFGNLLPLAMVAAGMAMIEYNKPNVKESEVEEDGI